MRIVAIAPQLRTTNLAASIAFYTEKLGFKLEFVYENFYAGIRAGDQLFHLKHVDEKDPSIDYVEHGDHLHLYLQTDDIVTAAEALRRNGGRFVKDVHDTTWKTREFVIHDDQGHTLYFGEPR